MKKLFQWMVLTLLLSASAWGQTSDELISFMTPVDGWAINRDLIEVFHEDNLHERINGASPGYFAYHFEEMTSVDYQKSNLYITIQAYRHATPHDAFGIYSAERSATAEFLPIGAEGYREGSILNFLAGRMYVKIQSPDTSPETVAAIEHIARNFAARIDSNPKLPDGVNALPAQSKKPHSEQYISTKFLGHDFLHGAFVATYTTPDDKTYKLFVIEGRDRDEIKEMLDQYFAFTKQEGQPAEGAVTAKDKYNGDVFMSWQGKYLWGIQNDWELSLDNSQLLKDIAQGLIAQGLIEK